MGLITETAVIVVSAEAGIHAVVVGGGIAMIGGISVLRIGGIVLQHRRKPQRRHTEFREVVEVFADTVQVTAMTQRRLGAVFLIVSHTLDLRIMTGSLCKAVGHQHIEHIGIGETHTLVATHLPLFQPIVVSQLLTPSLLLSFKYQGHCARLGVLQVHIDEQIVWRVEAHKAVNPDTRIISCHTGDVADALAIHHQLHSGVLHPHVPVGGLNTVNHWFFSCTHCHHVGHQNGGY